MTGEHRRYSRSSGTFSFVRPQNNFGIGSGWGAWEVAARYSRLDLDDRNIKGGKLDNITVGLNWHLNPNTRVMWNYVNADRDNIGKADIYMMRLQQMRVSANFMGRDTSSISRHFLLSASGLRLRPGGPSIKQRQGACINVHDALPILSKSAPYMPRGNPGFGKSDFSLRSK